MVVSKALTYIRNIFETSGIPVAALEGLSDLESVDLMALTQNMTLAEPVGDDMHGILTCTTQALKRRKGFLNALPRLVDYSELDELVKHLKSLASSRYRPLRSASTLASLSLLDQLLRSRDPGPVDPKKVLSVCVKLSVGIVIPRSRDTFTVIRHMVAEWMGRLGCSRSEFLTSSVFGRTGAIMTCISDLLIDDEPEVRSTMIASLSDILEKRVSVSFSDELYRLILRSFLVRCEDVRDGESKESELEAHSNLISLIPSKYIDPFDDYDYMLQTMWDSLLPVSVRSNLARLVSRNVFGRDIYDSTFCNFSRGTEMILAFVDQYKPPGADNHVPVFKAFFHRMDQTSIQGFLIAACEANQGPLVESIASTALEQRYMGLKIPPTVPSDIHASNGLFMLGKVGADFSYIRTDLRKRLVISSSEPSYMHKYLTYSLWRLVGMEDPEFHDLLRTHSQTLQSEHNIPSLHALESVIDESVVDIDDAEKLLDFVAHGEVDSVASLICALDLVLMVALRDTTERHSNLKNKLGDIMRKILKETQADSGSDAQSICFYCKYRLPTLEDGGSTKGPAKSNRIAFDCKSGPLEHMSSNSFVIASLLDSTGTDPEQLLRVFD
jgi:hypothetical protein